MKTVVLLFFVTVSLAWGYQQTKPDTQWNVVTLKEYIDQRLTSMQLAITKAEEATENRFEGVNEFRSTLADQQRTFIPRSEYESNHATIVADLLNVHKELDKIENIKQGGNVVWAYVVSAISLIIAVISFTDRFIRGMKK